MEWWKGERVVHDISGKATLAIGTKNVSSKTSLKTVVSIKRKWESEEWTALQCAESSTDVKAPYFWQAVAKMVPHRTAKECHEKWFSQFKSPAEKKDKKKEKNIKPQTQKLAGVNTQKFKAQVRDFVEREEANQGDDIFDFLTPGKLKPRFMHDLISPASNPSKTPVKGSDMDSDSGEEGVIVSWGNKKDQKEIDAYVHGFKKTLDLKISHSTPAKKIYHKSHGIKQVEI